jgi:hypothetical protein
MSKRSFLNELELLELELFLSQMPEPSEYINTKDTFDYRPDIYKTKTEDFRTATHIGQRKLLLTEMYFFAKCLNINSTILYIGSAPGMHIAMFARLFPNNSFILYDPAKFNDMLYSIPNITIVNKLFLQEDFDSFKDKKDLLFISDIRTQNSGNLPKESDIILDMQLQKDFVTSLRPKASMLKFRPPFFDANSQFYEYLDGEIIYQPWAPKGSTETRLIVTDPDSIKLYDLKQYDNKLYYQKIFEREWGKYKTVLIPGYCKCYECFMEQKIITYYLNEIEGGYDIKKYLAILKLINRYCSELKFIEHSKSM